MKQSYDKNSVENEREPSILEYAVVILMVIITTIVQLFKLKDKQK